MSDLYMSYKILESNEMHFKTCTKCGETLPATTEYFHKKKSGKYGLSSTCKKCRAEYGKQYHNDNKDKIAEQKKQWYKDNKDKIAEYKKQWYKDNKDKILEQQKQYRATPQGQTSAFNGRCRRRTKEQNQGNGITKEQWLECMKFFNWKCAYSGQVLSKDTRSLDHIIPLNNGGKHEIWNLVPMYKPYNSSKHDKDMEEWYKQQDFYSEERLQKIYEWQEYAFTKYSLELEKVK
jgi:5-methylcytosine-specific restriction endonuclease McrA